MTGASAVITTDAQRGAGSLTPGEVRAVVARFLAPDEVAALARAAVHRTALRPVLDELRSLYRGYAGGGTICTATARGLAVEIGERGGLIPWRLLAQVVADGATPERVAALDAALTSNRQAADGGQGGPGDLRAAREHADGIVLAGPAATQLDLLDALDNQAAPAVEDEPHAGTGRTTRKGAAKPALTRRPARTAGGAA